MVSESPLITAEALHEASGAPGVRIFDCRFSLMDPALGERQYLEGHVPGAMHADLDRHLADLSIAHRGRHPLPDRERFIRWLESCGVSDDSTLVAYDDAGGAIAARLWWMAGWAGLADARVLDGGLAAWIGAGYPVEQALPEPAAGRITRREPGRATTDVDAITAIARGEASQVLLDARDAVRYRGEKEPLDPVAGHIPGALNAPFSGNLDASRRFLPADVLRARFESLAGGGDPAAVIHMCGSGVTACHNLLAMDVAGLYGSRLFPGSWSEWVDDRTRPVATGEENPTRNTE